MEKIILVVVIIIMFVVYYETTVKKNKRDNLLLDMAEAQLVIFFTHLSKKYLIENDEKSIMFGKSNKKNPYVSYIKQLLDRFKFVNLYEISPGNIGGDSAYTINKKSVYICLKNRVYPYNIHNINTVMFVLIHELTHISNASWNHPNEFWILFKFLLLEAVECNVYRPINYSIYPELYCNTLIKYNPLFDNSLDISNTGELSVLY